MAGNGAGVPVLAYEMEAQALSQDGADSLVTVAIADVVGAPPANLLMTWREISEDLSDLSEIRRLINDRSGVAAPEELFEPLRRPRDVSDHLIRATQP